MLIDHGSKVYYQEKIIQMFITSLQNLNKNITQSTLIASRRSSSIRKLKEQEYRVF